jgi:S-formylglutathione hydrolase FrmB
MITSRWIAFLFMACVATVSRAADPAHAGRLERITVHGTSLEGNLAGDSPDREVSVYLPPGYEKSRQRYPVLYLLHGYTDSDAKWFGLAGPHFVNVPKAADAAAARGVKPMIVVMPNACTKFQGSFYGSSVVTGDWERFVTRELVDYIDAHYRTVADVRSRGLAGHSMGGYGTLRLALKAPGVFSSVYAMSPCCLDANPKPPIDRLENAAKVHDDAGIGAADFLTKAMLASAAAWSPDPRSPPLYITLPFDNGQLKPEILIRWAANSPLVMVHQYLPALKSYRGVFIDSGDQDTGIAANVRELHGVLEAYGIAHGYEIYEGDHLNRIEQRLTEKVLPFFGGRLEIPR